MSGVISSLKTLLEETVVFNSQRLEQSERSQQRSMEMMQSYQREIHSESEEELLTSNHQEGFESVNQELIENMDNNQESAQGFVSRNVVNLSERCLLDSEIKVLSRGLNFCPTPLEINKFELAKDLFGFGRKMKCRAYFAKAADGEVTDLSRMDRFKVKSSWVPPQVDPALELFLTALETKVFSIKEKGRNFRNLSKDEWKALQNLKRYPDIVIKEADKGSAVVVWGIKEYRVEAERQLGERARSMNRWI